MLTEFERIPDAFVSRYDAELQTWARKFREWGPQCQIRLRGPIVGVPAVDGTGEAPLVHVRLKARRDGSRMVVMPAGEFSEDLIRRHVEALRN